MLAPHTIVHVRQRTWLISAVRRHGPTHTVELACLDDDAAGEPATVIWEAELDARVLHAAQAEARPVPRLDPPEVFAAWLHTMRWSMVTSTDPRLLQAPFRAGIDLKAWQLEPLRKALALPRTSLFIADDVGLGKTVEAGLVLTELLLRQRVDRVLVVCPPAVVHQWRQELLERFGLDFAVYDADWVAERRRERGWAINPWSTHRRFIVSYSLLRQPPRGRRPSHLQALLHDLLADQGGGRVPRSLLILDEAHNTAPSADRLYVSDTATTAAIRKLAPSFEHRIFLSATPHNGHPRSFAHLLHLLDDQRFLRGVPIRGPEELAPVMVRRLKRHLRQEATGFPVRQLVDHPVPQPPDDPERQLALLLADYDRAWRQAHAHLPPATLAMRSLVLVTLHKRLLSSLAAFAHTLDVHMRHAEPLSVDLPEEEDDLDQRHEAEDAAAAGTALAGHELLLRMRELAHEHKARPDARVRALAAWMREHLLDARGQWGTERVILFTEYEHTLAWLDRALRVELSRGGVRVDTTGRIERFTGRLSDDARRALQTAFNSPTSRVRILLATDAAREGINLQGACRHLWHFDLPWNPGRIEQRNGRIDRVLQPSPEVFCHHFDLPDRPDDKVLRYLLRKTENIREQLGSLSDVVSQRVAERLARGARDLTTAEADALLEPGADALRAASALEVADAGLLRGSTAALQQQLDDSARRIAYGREHLRQAVDVALREITGLGLQPADPVDGVPAWRLPELTGDWEGVLGTLRDPEGQVRPVSFEAPHRLDAAVVQLHLGHPLVRRLLHRFRAHGFADGALSRVTAVRTPDQHVRRALLLGRVSLFGAGAARLHEELVCVAGTITPDGVRVRDDAPEVLRDLDASWRHGPPSDPRLIPHYAGAAWGALEAPLRAAAGEAEARARALLDQRGEEEATSMATLLRDQLRRIEQSLADPGFAPEHRALKARHDRLAADLDGEPERIRAGYRVVLARTEVVGLAVLWPDS